MSSRNIDKILTLIVTIKQIKRRYNRGVLSITDAHTAIFDLYKSFRFPADLSAYRVCKEIFSLSVMTMTDRDFDERAMTALKEAAL